MNSVEAKPVPDKPKPPEKKVEPVTKPVVKKTVKKKIEKKTVKKIVTSDPLMEQKLVVEPEPIESLLQHQEVESIPDKSEVSEVASKVDDAVKRVENHQTPTQIYMDHHLKAISKLLQENLYYPRIARKRGIVGEVKVIFELQTDGSATHVRITSGTKSILNKAAVTTIERLSGKFPTPPIPLTLSVPINYQLQ